MSEGIPVHWASLNEPSLHDMRVLVVSKPAEDGRLAGVVVPQWFTQAFIDMGHTHAAAVEFFAEPENITIGEYAGLLYVESGFTKYNDDYMTCQQTWTLDNTIIWKTEQPIATRIT